jgi:hypothetical protein
MSPTSPPTAGANTKGAVVTLRGSTTTPPLGQDPGAANIKLSHGSGASAKSCGIEVDRNGNLIVSQQSPGGALHFDLNSDSNIFFRDRENGHAHRIALSSAVAQFNIPIKIPTYTLATAPSASAAGGGAQIYIADGDAGNPCLAVSDGAHWRRIASGALAANNASYQFFSHQNANAAAITTASPPSASAPSSSTPSSRVHAPSQSTGGPAQAGPSAARIHLSHGPSAKSGHMAIDSDGNLIFSQNSTGGGLYFDFNGSIFFRDRANKYAQRIGISSIVAQFNVPVRVPNHTLATAPRASAAGSGAQIYLTDGDAGNPCLAVSDGTSWRRITFGALAIGTESSGFFSPSNSNAASLPTASVPINSARPSSTPGLQPTGASGTARAVENAPFLRRFVISSTIPSNGDLNPYGVAFVPQGFAAGGTIAPGDLLVSNFNAKSNLKGTGTTIVKLTLDTTITPSVPVGRSGADTFYQSRKQVGLTTALGVLQGGFILVGNVPTTDGTSATISQGSLQIVDRYGNLVGSLIDSIFIDSPWGLAINDQGSKAQVFVSNVLSGTVSRLDLAVTASKVTVLKKTAIATGYTHRPDANALVLGPTGLAYDAAADTLYVASTADNTIFVVPRAGSSSPIANKGTPVFADPDHLRGPLGLAFTPNGHLLTANGDAVNADPTRPSRIIEFTTSGEFIAESNIDPDVYAAFGLATLLSGNPGLNFAAVNGNSNSVAVVQTD